MKIIFILLALFFVLKLLTKYLGPLLLKYISNKLNNKINEQFQSTNDFKNQKNNQTRVNYKKQKRKKNVGEYIDFEEID